MGTPLLSLLPFSDRQKCTQTLFGSCPETGGDCGGLFVLCGAEPHCHEIRQTALTQDPVPVLSKQPSALVGKLTVLGLGFLAATEKTIAVISGTTSAPKYSLLASLSAAVMKDSIEEA